MEQDSEILASLPSDHRLPTRKLHPPALPPAYIARDALHARLTSSVEGGSVTLLSAPTGYGKSTVLAAWSAASAWPVAWLTIDELDDDARTLWLGIRGTLASALVRSGRTDPVQLEEVEAPCGVGDSGLAIDELMSRLDGLVDPLVLVIDNVDEITSPPALGILDRLLRYAPEQVRVVLSGRCDPGVALHKLRIAGRLHELRHQDLRFTAGDARRLAEVCGVALTAADQGDLLEATGGWPVAVKMVLGAMAQSPTRATARALLRPTSSVADALVSQVLASLGPQLREFVLAATTCRTVDARLADALNGGEGGAQLLAQCVERGLFLDRQSTGEGEPVSYRWHDTFAAQCQAKLASSHPRRWRELHRSVAHHRRETDLHEAVTHALRGGRPGLAASYLHERWIEMVLRGDQAQLLALCHRIPPPLDQSPEMLLLMAACHYLEGDLTQAALLLRRARSTSGGQALSRHRFSLLEDLLGVTLVGRRTDLGTMVALCEGLLAAVPPDGDAVVVAGAEHIVGRLLARAGRPAAAIALFEASTAVGTARSMVALRLAGEAELSLLIRDRDGVGAGRRAAVAVVDEARARGWDSPPILAPAFLTLAMCEYDRDDLEAARGWAAAAVSATRPADRVQVALVRATHLEIALAAGDPGAVQSDVDALASLEGQDLPPSWSVVLAVLSARWHLARGERAQASSIVAGLAATSDLGWELAGHPGVLVWAAEILRRCGALEAAGEMLAHVPPGCRASQVLTAQHLVAALLATAVGDLDRGHQLLESALACADLENIRRPFTERREEILPLLTEHLSWGTDHAAFIIALLEHLPAARVVPALTSRWSLTPREHEVLQYLRTSMTASDIAAAAFVSINTVRTHQRAIYRKLGVEGRRDAVRVATERGLL